MWRGLLSNQYLVVGTDSPGEFLIPGPGISNGEVPSLLPAAGINFVILTAVYMPPRADVNCIE